MRILVYIVGVSLATHSFAAKKQHTIVRVRAVTHASQVSERTSSYTTPGRSSTSCSGTAVALGSTTAANANCETTSVPAQTRQITRRLVQVVNVVEAGGWFYTISCTGNWVGSNCAPMIDGDVFDAEVNGNTMWVSAHQGGNMGKLVTVKYRIMDIQFNRQVAEQQGAAAEAAK